MEKKEQSKKLALMHQKLTEYQSYEHKRNLKKIRIGIWMLWIIPIVFLLLLFITNSNKIIFLVLWIVSLFAIAAYLIVVEYHDYSLQKAINEIRGDADAEVEQLLDIDEAGERVTKTIEQIKAKGRKDNEKEEQSES